MSNLQTVADRIKDALQFNGFENVEMIEGEDPDDTIEMSFSYDDKDYILNLDNA